MRIQVLHEDGKQEILDLPAGSRGEVREGSHMNHLHGEHGFDHYSLFDGTYDGWSGLVRCSSPEAAEIISAQEDARCYIGAGGHKS